MKAKKRRRRWRYQEKTLPDFPNPPQKKKNFEPQRNNMVEGDCYPTVGGMCDVGWQ